jgi:hypothetical protein
MSDQEAHTGHGRDFSGQGRRTAVVHGVPPTFDEATSQRIVCRRSRMPGGDLAAPPACNHALLPG